MRHARSAAFTPVHRPMTRDILSPHTVRTLKRRKRRVPGVRPFVRRISISEFGLSHADRESGVPRGVRDFWARIAGSTVFAGEGLESRDLDSYKKVRPTRRGRG